MSPRVRLLTVRAQCQFPSAAMLNAGGCTYGTAEERARWRVRHFERNRRHGWPSGYRDPDYCSRTAKWQIDGGLHLCALHAGAEALHVLMTGRAPPEQGDDEMAKMSISQTLGLPGHLADGGTLKNMREHAARIRDEIDETSKEVGGDPWRSVRYREALRVIELVDGFKELALGHYNPPIAVPPDDDLPEKSR